MLYHPYQLYQFFRFYVHSILRPVVVRKELTVNNIKQFYIETRKSNKLEVLTRLIDVYNPKLTVVFTNTKKGADELVSDLQARS